MINGRAPEGGRCSLLALLALALLLGVAYTVYVGARVVGGLERGAELLMTSAAKLEAGKMRGAFPV